MSKKLYFACDRCFNKVSFREVFKFGKSSKTTCEYCKSELIPIYPVSFKWAFFIGFVCTTIPAELYLNFYNDLLIAFVFALIGAAISMLGIVILTYNSTVFTSIP